MKQKVVIHSLFYVSALQGEKNNRHLFQNNLQTGSFYQSIRKKEFLIINDA